MSISVVFRADASTGLGAGHVVRCATLAKALTHRGAQIAFVSRSSAGDLIDWTRQQGFPVAELPPVACNQDSCRAVGQDALTDVSSRDASQTISALRTLGIRPDWIVVDHYALGRPWEEEVRVAGRLVMAIDDLADREHDCDLLLDQNLAHPGHAEYARLVPETATRLIGPKYALVRRDFRLARERSLARRDGYINRVLVSMGGSDPQDDTSRAIHGLHLLGRSGLAVDVVIGSGNPNRGAVSALCAQIQGMELHVQTTRMADLMSGADLAVAASGSTTWERCVVGLPAITVIQSADQVAIAKAMEQAGADALLGCSRDLTDNDYRVAIADLAPESIRHRSAICAGLCDGWGADRVAEQLISNAVRCEHA